MRKTISLVLILALTACATSGQRGVTDSVVISIVGTNDVHGELLPQPNRGGIVTFSGYVAALREARQNDGAVLLVDAGDMWQGTLESNLSEGMPVVEAYNALGYAAAAIGNHEFDFGPLGPKSIPETEADDPRGALKRRATQTRFPLLAANLVVSSTGDPVAWDNVRSSVMVNSAGVDVGLIGVVTDRALLTTIAANTVGLEITPLADAITAEARALRDAGATLVVVLAHAGSDCDEFDDPLDLSSCNMAGEIMRVANAIPVGLVDHIVAGHKHDGIAHVVNGIAVTASYAKSAAFSRVDFTIDRNSGEVTGRRIFGPQRIVAGVQYEGRLVVPMEEVVVIAAKAGELAAKLQAEKLGVILETPMTLDSRPEAVLGNLMTDALLESYDADISFHNVFGGIRAELPVGELTYGDVYRMFPFDNRVAIVEMSGAEVRRIIASQVRNVGRRAGFSGMRVFVGCNDDGMSIDMRRPDNREITDSDTLSVVVNDFLLLGGDDVLTPVIPEQGFEIPQNTPLVRDTLVQWFRSYGGTLRAGQFLDPENRRWNLPEVIPDSCVYSN